MTPRPLRTPMTVAVLGLLAERARHVYDMRLEMRERGHDRTLKIKNASFYDVLPRLVGAGLVTQGETVREGARPERTVYHITVAGRARLRDWLRELFDGPEGDTSGFTVALMFMFALPRTEVIALLERRAERTERHVGETGQALDAAARNGVGPVFLADHAFPLALRRAELDWLRAFAAQLRDPATTWPDPESPKRDVR
ncbi:PadR family transcriptional regulator [Nonomuraea sp. SMC257]|uniref:PadR family transcriptional regulator n=1 Tax=Nonomuraea montanisoli TaxID=2741721 RepID=A0A7Y6IAM9_9ACTN|nr:PadR family transcriptional regulator [Nonomuraea montanisoli]NUW34722.1 PadR family transcriptional regulator [Nonomuraea montanisoli]